MWDSMKVEQILQNTLDSHAGRGTSGRKVNPIPKIHILSWSTGKQGAVGWMLLVRDGTQIGSSALISVSGKSIVAVAKSAMVRVSLSCWDQAAPPALPLWLLCS